MARRLSLAQAGHRYETRAPSLVVVHPRANQSSAVAPQMEHDGSTHTSVDESMR